VNWFRKHLKHGSRLALLALAIQFALSFGHFHADVARAAPALQTGSADGLAIAATVTPPATPAEAGQLPSNHTDQHGADCAVCAVLSLANNFLFAASPHLELPQAAALRHLATGTEFNHPGSPHPAFQSRAPPAS
jgi:hypothetical protein